MLGANDRRNIMRAAKFHGSVDKPRRSELYDRQTMRMCTTVKAVRR